MTYEVYAKSQNQIRSYEIRYTLDDVVKYVDNDFYIFSYRFLPNDYKNKVKDFNVYILAPEGESVMKFTPFSKLFLCK